MEFAAIPGAPSFQPVKVNFHTVVSSSTIAPSEPHVPLGELVLRAVAGDPPLDRDQMVTVLRDEGRRRGGNAMFVTSCDAPTECRASLFRTGPEAEAYLQAGSSGAATASPTSADLVPNNPALSKGLIGIWIPDANGNIADNAREIFEKELVRSTLYINQGPAPRSEAGKLFVYTDEASVVNAEGPRAKAAPVDPARMIELAHRQKLVLYVLYEQGNEGTSLFTALDENFLPDLLTRLKAR